METEFSGQPTNPGFPGKQLVNWCVRYVTKLA